jgi:hypothetical protein
MSSRDAERKGSKKNASRHARGERDPIREYGARLAQLSGGGGMSKSPAKKATTGKAALVTAAEKAGRSLGRAVGAVERAISRVRARKAGKPARKRAQGRKRR